MDKIALIVIYNHQYLKNIDTVEKIYKDRFSNIYHLVPFYNGDRRNVIAIYECSYHFQGYVSQGLKSYYNKDYSHYFFISDDLVLNPNINERNYSTYFKIGPNTCFIPDFISLHKIDFWWQRVSEAYSWRINIPGIEAKNQLVDYDVAIEKFRNFGLTVEPIRFNRIWKTPNTFTQWMLPLVSRRLLTHLPFIFRYIKSRMMNKKFSLHFPLVGSYSDIFIVNSDTIKQFSHFCGVFAATKLHVEVGLPTSMVLSAKEIVTEKELHLKGGALWTTDQLKELDKYNYSLKKLLTEFPNEYLYIHPIKFSKWDTEL